MSRNRAKQRQKLKIKKIVDRGLKNQLRKEMEHGWSYVHGNIKTPDKTVQDMIYENR